MSKTDSILIGFAPVYRADARVLVLGSMPGIASLQAGRYYAHPRNAFWLIMDELCGAGPGLPYAQRLQCLRAGGMALWDVLHQCRRPGSLDSNIRHQDLQVNDFAALLQHCPSLECIVFNGGKAAQLFRRLALPTLQQHAQLAPRLHDMVLQSMPSTSPAYAAMPLAQKLITWQQLIWPHLQRR